MIAESLKKSDSANKDELALLEETNLELQELTKKTSFEDTDLKEVEFINLEATVEAEAEVEDDDEEANPEKIAAAAEALKKQMIAA
jgi:Fe-S-cluster formation regulator IscX/YfhJ